MFGDINSLEDTLNTEILINNYTFVVIWIGMAPYTHVFEWLVHRGVTLLSGMTLLE